MDFLENSLRPTWGLPCVGGSPGGRRETGRERSPRWLVSWVGRSLRDCVGTPQICHPRTHRAWSTRHLSAIGCASVSVEGLPRLQRKPRGSRAEGPGGAARCPLAPRRHTPERGGRRGGSAPHDRLHRLFTTRRFPCVCFCSLPPRPRTVVSSSSAGLRISAHRCA